MSVDTGSTIETAGIGSGVSRSRSWAFFKTLLAAMLVIVIFMAITVGFSTNKIYQPRGALITASEDYARVYLEFRECVQREGGCPNSDITRLINKREDILARDWPQILDFLVNLGNWRAAPHAVEPVANTWSETYRNFPDYEIAVRFFGLIEDAGGIKAASNCLPWVEWVAADQGWQSFQGLICGATQIKMR